MLAHIVGIPVEEALPWMAPLGGLSFAAGLALARSYASARWRRDRVARAQRGAA